MYLDQNSREYGIDETAVDSAIKSGNIFNARNTKTAEAFSVNTEEITYLALLYTDSQQHYQGTGFVVFADGEKWHFCMDEREEPDVREKCRSMAQRIARMYEGCLEHRVVAGDGK